MSTSDIPAYLRIPQEVRTAAWRSAPPAKAIRAGRARKHPFHLPATIDAAGIVLLRQVKQTKAQRTRERLAALKERQTARTRPNRSTTSDRV